jgi:hypothetical protein
MLLIIVQNPNIAGDVKFQGKSSEIKLAVRRLKK